MQNRIKPVVGQKMIINRVWFEPNEFMVQFMKTLQPARVYEILNVVEQVFVDGIPSWGITKIRDVITDEIFDIKDHPELDDYWCMFDSDDSIRIVDV